jgi:hypothetical protein
LFQSLDKHICVWPEHSMTELDFNSPSPAPQA